MIKLAMKDGFGYRKGSSLESSKYKHRYIPHIVFTDLKGKELSSYDAMEIRSMNKSSRLTDLLRIQARRLSPKWNDINK